MILFNKILIILSAVTLGYPGSLLAVEDAPVISIAQGKLQGLTYLSRHGNKYYGFLGVPYAKASERFAPPQEADGWDDVKLATKFPEHCYQFCLIQGRLRGVEDCLTLNLYSPKLDVNSKLPVMVLFHGGGWQIGGSDLHEAKYFMDEEVVLVVVQYRLGALGFLSTGDDVVSGNMGLKDQTAALKWVQKNIDKFGGDSNKVTIFGYSAGGASVHFHMLSPLSKGLFSRAISQSGSALAPWALQHHPKRIAVKLAEDVGCSIKTSEKMVECLRSKPASEIITAQLKFSKFPHEFDLISMLFRPSVEKGNSANKFLSETPYKLLTSGKTESQVPWIIGVTRDEGALYTANILEDEKSMELINKDWFKMLPNILYFENSASPAKHNEISRKVLEFYFGKEKITRDKSIELGRVYGDRFFVTPVSRAIREYVITSPKSPVYPYIFEFDGAQSIVKTFCHTKEAYGVSHGDDLKYLFNGTYGAPEYKSGTEEGQFSENLVKLFVSFARDGKPSATFGSARKWEPFNLSREESVEKASVTWYAIGKDTQIFKEDPFKARTKFWEGLPIKELEKVDYENEKDEL